MNVKESICLTPKIDSISNQELHFLSERERGKKYRSGFDIPPVVIWPS